MIIIHLLIIIVVVIGVVVEKKSRQYRSVGNKQAKCFYAGSAVLLIIAKRLLLGFLWFMMTTKVRQAFHKHIQ